MLAKSLIDADARELLEPFNDLTKEGSDNEFTVEDIEAAAGFYDTRFAVMTRKEISRRTKIEIQPARRNGRTQKEHLKRAGLVRTISSYDEVGRPDKRDIVKEWRAAHEYGKKADCIRETGLDKKTVYKWWDSE